MKKLNWKSPKADIYREYKLLVDTLQRIHELTAPWCENDVNAQPKHVPIRNLTMAKPFDKIENQTLMDTTSIDDGPSKVNAADMKSNLMLKPALKIAKPQTKLENGTHADENSDGNNNDLFARLKKNQPPGKSKATLPTNLNGRPSPYGHQRPKLDFGSTVVVQIYRDAKIPVKTPKIEQMAENGHVQQLRRSMRQKRKPFTKTDIFTQNFQF